MESLPALEQAKKAILHALAQARDVPQLGYYINVGTQTFSLLTEAYATIEGKAVKDVRDAFRCLHPAAPHCYDCTAPDSSDDITESSNRDDITPLLDLFPEHAGINWASYDDGQLLDFLTQSIRKRL